MPHQNLLLPRTGRRQTPLRQKAPEGLSQRTIETDFSGGAITSNAGVTLLGHADKRLDLTRRFAAAGIEDARGRKIVANFDLMDEILVDLCVDGFAEEPDEVIVDLDANDIPLHGKQGERFYHGHYRCYCTMPLLFLVGEQPVMVRLRSAARDAAAGVAEDLGWLVDRLREAWSSTRIILRTDSGFCREPIMAACESRERVDFVTGMAKNKRLGREIEAELDEAQAEAKETGKVARRFRNFRYATLRERRVIGKAEALPRAVEGGTAKWNPRFIVTSLPEKTHPARELYEQFYCARGDAENRVKDHKLTLFSKRCSSNLFDANTLRFYLSTFAMILFQALQKALADTRLAAASLPTVRLRLLKIGAVVRISIRRVHIAMSSACPDQDLFELAWRRLILT